MSDIYNVAYNYFFGVGCDGFAITSLYPKWDKRHEDVLNKVRVVFGDMMEIRSFSDLWSSVVKCEHRFPDGTIPDFHPEFPPVL